MFLTVCCFEPVVGLSWAPPGSLLNESQPPSNTLVVVARGKADPAMLDLDVARPGTTHRFAFGGVAFELEVGEGVDWQLWPEFARHTCASDRYPLVARVQCRVTVDPSLSGPGKPARGILVERRGESTESTVLVAPGDVHAEFEADGPGRYIASVRISPRRATDPMPQAPDAVLLGLSTAILEREGGVSLHAAAIELEGRAVVFIGPSGAGKSTAARLSSGSRLFAFDRVNIAPDGAGSYVAWSLPGGSPVAGPASSHRRLPLGAILRVRQGRGAPRIHELAAAQGIFALRESMWLTDLSPTAEEQRIDAATLLRGGVRVAEIHTVLDQSHTALLAQWMFARDSVDPCAGVAL
jgi:hypothetical protein